MIIAHPAQPSTRELRALELHRTRGDEIRKVGENLYLVPSCTGQGSYTVDYNEESCGCPDYRNRKDTCKHILAVGISLAKCRRPHACIDSWVYVGYLDDNDVE